MIAARQSKGRQVSLGVLRIASPCPANWDDMDGDDHARFCHQCSKHVFDLSEMDDAQVVDLIQHTEGKFCGRLYQRTDERVLTADCPVGMARVARHARRVRALCAAMILAVFGLYGAAYAAMIANQESPSIIAENAFFQRLSRWTFGERRALGMMIVPPVLPHSAARADSGAELP